MIIWFLIGIAIGCVIGCLATWQVFIKEAIPRMMLKLEKEGYVKILKPVKEKWNK